jgi:hypothetical protein
MKCRECSGEVSTSAKSCPRCGAPIKVPVKVSFVVLSVLGFLVMFGLAANYLPDDKVKQSDPPADSASDVGADVVLRVSSGDVVLGVDELAYGEFIKLALAKDYLGMGQMEGAGKLFRVPSGTKARVVDSGFEKRQVRIMEGSSFGRSGWVTSTVVQ